jgi:hypothetical protein
VKAILEFNLPEDDYEWKIVSKGLEYHNVLSNLDEFLRGKIKHSESSAEKFEAYQEVRDLIRDEMNDRNIDF